MVLDKEKIFDRYILYTALLAFLTASVTIGYFMLKSKGFLTVVDDFDTQQLTFNTLLQNIVKNKDLGGWTWQLDLGSSVVNGFSFYNLGSPFLWLGLLGPKGMFPYYVGLIYILKYTCAAIFAYYYLKLYVNRPVYAMVGAMLYAFSGFQSINLMFYHFHDVVAFFPLLLICLEHAARGDDYKKLFVLSVGINCLINYFFFIQEVIFMLLFYLFRFSYDKLSVRLHELRDLILCGLLGTGLASVLFVPSCAYILGNTRSSQNVDLSSLFYDAMHVLFVLKGILLPADSMNHLSAVYSTNYASTSCYLPLLGVSLVICYVIRKRDWISRMILFMAVLSLSPLLQSGFLLFTASYQRWWYMACLILILASVKVLDSPGEYRIARGVGINTLLVLMLYGLLTWNQRVLYEEHLIPLILIAVIGPLVLMVVNSFKKGNQILLVGLVLIACSLTTALDLHYYRENKDDPSIVDPNLTVREQFDLGRRLEKIDDQYRYNETRNLYTMPGQAAGIGGFSSTIENASREFDTLFDQHTTVRTPYRSEVKGVRELLGGKYRISKHFDRKNNVTAYSLDRKTYYVNESQACPIGFALDHYVTEEDLKLVSVDRRACVLMNALVLDRKSAEVSGLKKIKLTRINKADMKKYISACVDRAVSDFRRDSDGFSCRSSYGSSEWVYFTVPYDTGWTATIDGKPKDITKSGGMMALQIPAGEHAVIFHYQTPWLRVGIWISVCSLLVYLIWMWVNTHRNRRVYKHERKTVHCCSLLQ